MTIDGPITTLELREFRLNEADTEGEAARLLASFSNGIEPAVPLLVSVDDRRDVAIVRALHASETAASGQDIKRYRPRIAERAEVPPTHYRLAVTESGINDAERDAFETPRPAQAGTSTPIGLLWIGTPVGTGAGLLVLLGNDDGQHVRPDAHEWPLPLSRSLGVRIYEGQR